MSWRSEKIAQAAGSGDHDARRCESAFSWTRSFMPPTATAARMPVPRAILPNASVICRASSRVGVRIDAADARLRAWLSSNWMSRQYKRKGLSGSGLGGGDQVASGQCRLDGLGLNRGWLGEVVLREIALQLSRRV